jgi:hypothetical protein
MCQVWRSESDPLGRRLSAMPEGRMIDRALTWILSRVRYWRMERRLLRVGTLYVEKPKP